MEDIDVLPPSKCWHIHIDSIAHSQSLYQNLCFIAHSLSAMSLVFTFLNGFSHNTKMLYYLPPLNVLGLAAPPATTPVSQSFSEPGFSRVTCKCYCTFSLNSLFSKLSNWFHSCRFT
jgi:hypothetical protein